MSSTRHDELVEEIRWLICPVCEFYNPDCERCDSAAGLCDEVIVATDLILTATLNAVVDGKLDEVLGVVGRGGVSAKRASAFKPINEEEFPATVKTWLIEGYIKSAENLQGISGIPVIALRPTGTGEEE